jgi:isopentenyldiphosphate isomerase
MEKFMTRITISSMRIITKIAQELNIHAEEIGASQIVQWIEYDSQIRKEQGEDAAFLKWTSPHPDLDFEDTRQDEVTPANLSSHEKFLTRMVISAMSALVAIAKDHSAHIEDLTVSQIISWVERDAKVKREQGVEAAFLSW